MPQRMRSKERQQFEEEMKFSCTYIHKKLYLHQSKAQSNLRAPPSVGRDPLGHGGF